MSVFQNMNQFGQTPLKGLVAAIINPDTLSVRVDPNSVATLVPGDAVVLTTTAGNEILVDKALASQIAFGIVIYQVKIDKFKANDLMEIALNSSVIYVEASGTITRNQYVEFVAATSTMIASSGTNPVVGLALDSATSGNLFRILVRATVALNTGGSTVVTVPATSGNVALNPAAGGVFLYTPTLGGTITAISVVAGQKISFLILTAGTTSFNITFGTNFRATGVISTGSVASKYIGLDFVSDGTNYVQTGAGYWPAI